MTGHRFDELGPPGATVSALAVDDEGTVLAERNPDRTVAPASNAKLVTTALALEELGAGFQFETSVHATDDPVEGRLDGDLRLVGAGAPDFGRADLRTLAADLADRVDYVTGDLVIDSTLFEGPQYGPGRTWEDAQFAYGAPTTAISLDGNTVTLRITVDGTGDVRASVDPPSPVVDPRVDVTVVGAAASSEADGAASTDDADDPTPTVQAEPCDGVVRVEGELPPDDVFEIEVPIRRPVDQVGKEGLRILADAGVGVAGSVVVERDSSGDGTWPAREPIATVQSPPLSELLRKMNVPSDNVIADTLARVVAAHATGTGSWSAWTDLIAERLADLNVETVRIRDGSGLSRYNRLSARGFVALLRHAGTREWGSTFFESLPAPGEGTLADRLADLPVRAKTGTLTGTRALSGRICPDGGPVYFALLVDDVTCEIDGVRDDLDAVVRSLAEE